MAICITNGNPMVAAVFMSLSTFKESTNFVAAFTEISMTFTTEESANQFTKDVKSSGCTQSFNKSNNVVVVPDYSGSENAARAFYHAINNYKDHLVSVNKFELSPYLQEDNPVKDIEEYIKKYFGLDAISVI